MGNSNPQNANYKAILSEKGGKVYLHVNELGILASGEDIKSAYDDLSRKKAEVFAEFEAAGLTAVNGRLVDAAFVGEAYAALECRVTRMMAAPTLEGFSTESRLVFGQVVGIHIRDDAIGENGLLDMARIRPVGRMGYLDYAECGTPFQMKRPRRG